MLRAHQAVNAFTHQSVMPAEVVAGLSIRPDGCYVDATFGRGGHAQLILSRLSDNGRLIGLDRDPAAAATAQELAARDSRFAFEQKPFSELAGVIESRGLAGRVDGIVFDLGVSSPQLDDPDRGFSFRQSGPLDMRMDPARGQSAADWLNKASVGEIAGVLRRLGEEPMARRIAHAIVRAREESPITDTARLAALIEEAMPARLAAGKRVHPATRSFQAIRIHINNELAELEQALPQAVDTLASGGRLAVISFHSLEDRVVKRYLRTQARPPLPELPMAPVPKPRLSLVVGPQRAQAAEVAANPRARSAVLRVAERTEEGIHV